MYKKILVALDLSNDSNKVVDTAIHMAGNDASKLHLVHVVEPVAAAYSMDIYAVNINELQQEAISLAEKRLEKLGAEKGVSSDKIHTLLGAPAPEIRSLADEVGADAIVIGSHGFSGKKRMLGATANKLLHGAKCDILTVHATET